MHTALAGLSITYSLQVTVFMNWVVRMSTLLEAQMSSGARCTAPNSPGHVRHAVLLTAVTRRF